MNISVVEIIEYLKRHTRLIIVFVIIAALLGQVYVAQKQTYVASMTLKYTFENAEKGLNIKGGKLDVNEMISPAVIERVISSLKLNVSVEQIRSAITISPLIDATTKQKMQALAEKGEDFEYYPTEYTVSYKYSGKLGAKYGVKVLNKILEEYDSFIRENYTNHSKIANIFEDKNYSDYDYMEICDMFEKQINSGISAVATWSETDKNFRSAKTGLTFNDLQKYFQNLHDIDYMKLYSVVRVGCLSKNSEVLIKNYSYKIEENQLLFNKKSEEAKISFDLMRNFYAKYNNGETKNSLDSSLDNKASINMDIIQQDNYSKMLTTYDEIIMGYVDSEVAAKNAENESDYYKLLIDSYMNDSVSLEDKVIYSRQADTLIEKLGKAISEYTELANVTITDYNYYKGTQYLSYLSSVGTAPTLSRGTVTVFAVMLGICLAVVLILAIEIIKKIKEDSLLEDKKNKIALLEQGVLPVNLDKLPPLHRALFNAIANDFNEFSLHYQPIVDSEGVWIGAEAFLRWDSAEYGMVDASKLIEIAEKYDIMEIIGKWITKEACSTCRTCNRSISESIFICINFTLNQIGGKIFMDDVLHTLDESKVNPSNIVLEISGNGEIEDVDFISKKLIAIKTFGIKVAIDNFGSANKKLDSLHKLPVDIVKIGKRYTSNIDKGLGDREFIRDVVDVSHNLGFKVSAEGIENAKAANIVNALNVDFQQGYYYSRPMGKDLFIESLKKNREREKQKNS